MKIGMNLLLWTDCPTMKEHQGLLTKLKQWGFDGVEFPVAPMTREDVRGFSRECDGLGLGRTAILALDASMADPASADPALRKAAVAEIKRALDQTAEIGAGVLVGPLFQGLGRFSGKAATADEWKWAVETIRAAGEYAAAVGIKLALEPINRFEMYMVNTIGDGKRFVVDVGLPNVGLLADTHHGNIEENNTAQAWKEAAGHIFHVHISENHRGTPGSGQAISADVFRVLREIKYDGWLTIEAFGQSVPGLISRLHLWRTYAESDERLAREGLKFIREHA